MTAKGAMNLDQQYENATYVPLGVLRAKRFADIIISLLAILMTAPLWPMIAIAIRLESSGPIIFRQMRVGMATLTGVELFMMMKFRTMVVDAEKVTGAVWATKNDPRVTRVGKFLRKTRLDELPQLINVIKGEMSIVGPRPERPGIFNRLEQQIPFYLERVVYVKPGITGLAQVNQGYDTCLDDVKSKLAYDLSYSLALTRFSDWLAMDILILARTFWVMVTGKGQ